MREIRDPDSLEKIRICAEDPIIEAIKQMNHAATQILIVEDKGIVVGVVTDGDIRRAIIKGISFDSRVIEICNRSPKFVTEFDSEKARELMKDFGIMRIPVLDSNKRLIGIYKLEELVFLQESLIEETEVVVMAGGRGTRLKPITDVIPKALVPLNGKPMIELIMDSFSAQGVKNFTLSVNYKKEIIKAYFEGSEEYRDRITYIEEKDFLGTAGSLSLLSDKIEKTFFLTNCDILVKTRYDKALKYHKESQNSITIIGGVQNLSVPYGVIDVSDGMFVKMEEKPELHFIVNTGVYIIEPEVIREVLPNEKLDMTDLITRVKDKGFRIGVYPAHENWIDIGSFSELGKITKW